MSRQFVYVLIVMYCNELEASNAKDAAEHKRLMTKAAKGDLSAVFAAGDMA